MVQETTDIAISICGINLDPGSAVAPITLIMNDPDYYDDEDKYKWTQRLLIVILISTLILVMLLVLLTITS